MNTLPARRLFPRSEWLVIVWLTLTIPAVSAQGQENEAQAPTEREQLEAIDVALRTQAHEIESARVDLKVRFGPARETITAPTVDAAMEKLRQAFDTDDETAQRETFVKVVDELTSGKQWSEMRLTQQGESVRNRHVFQIETVHDFATHADHRTYYWDEGERKQAEIEAKDQPAKRLIRSVGLIRPILLELDEHWQVFPSDSPGSVAVGRTEKRPLFLWFDNESKVMTHLISGTPGSHYMFRGGLKTYTGDIVMPTYGFDVTLVGGKVRTFEAFMVEHAEYNIELNDTDLHLHVPAETRLIDRRNPKHVQHFKAPREGKAVTLADEFIANRKK